MTEWESGNWSFQEPPFKDGDIVSGGNNSQLYPGTEICKNVKNLIVTGGNFCNCKSQPSWDVRGGNWCQKSFCTHLLPHLIEVGIHPCEEHCEHYQGDFTETLPVDEAKDLVEKGQIPEAELIAAPKFQPKDQYGFSLGGETVDIAIPRYKHTNLTRVQEIS